MTNNITIELDNESINNTKAWLEERIKKCNKNTWTHRRCHNRSLRLLHQLMEWTDFIKNMELYKQLAESGDNRAKRMLQMLEHAMLFFREMRRKKKVDVSLGIIKYLWLGKTKTLELAIRIEKIKEDHYKIKTQIINTTYDLPELLYTD